jgi:hypothetical protein
MQKILDKFGITEKNFLGAGVECRVFYKDEREVIKIYNKFKDPSYVNKLSDFYNSLNPDYVNVQTPEILSAYDEDPEHTVLIEKRLAGICPTDEYLNSLELNKLIIFINNYVEFLFKIEVIETTFFDKENSAYKNKSFKFSTWNNSLFQNIVYFSSNISDNLKQTILYFDSKEEYLMKEIKNTKIEKISFVHGDASNKNILVDENFNISALYDFGSWTTSGDYIFDVAVGWLLFNKNKTIEKINATDYMLSLILKKLTRKERKRFYKYLLYYAFITLNMFAKGNIEDPHYSWCKEILNNQNNWREIGFTVS